MNSHWTALNTTEFSYQIWSCPIFFLKPKRADWLMCFRLLRWIFMSLVWLVCRNLMGSYEFVLWWCEVPYCINKPSLVPIRLKLFKWGHFYIKWGNFYIFSLSYNLTSDDLWPWYVTSDFINKWGFPCCIYDPTLVKIHQSMWKVEPNVNLFSQQKTTDNKQQQQQQGTKWSLCVFPAKAGDTKRE